MTPTEFQAAMRGVSTAFYTQLPRRCISAHDRLGLSAARAVYSEATTRFDYTRFLGQLKNWLGDKPLKLDE